jgi:hypothetical protein
MVNFDTEGFHYWVFSYAVLAIESISNVLLPYIEIWFADIQDYESLIMSTLFSLGGLLAHQQNPHSWRTSLASPLRTSEPRPQLQISRKKRSWTH